MIVPFFTAVGLKKLDDFRQKIQNIYDEKKYENKNDSSSYSKEMAKNALEIIDFLKKHNDDSITSLSKLKNLVQGIASRIGQIDNMSYTGVPVIFNTESLLLARAYQDFLKMLDFNKDVGSSFRLALSFKQMVSTETSQDLLTHYGREIESRIMLYEVCVNSNKCYTQQRPILNAIIKDMDYRDKPFIQDEAIFRKDYEAKVISFFQQMRAILYINTALFQSEYINQSVPYEIKGENIYTMMSFAGKQLYLQLALCEEETNKILPKEWKPLTAVYDYARQLFTEDKVSQRKLTIKTLYDQMETDIQAILSPKRFRFSSMDPYKKQLLGEILSEIKIKKENKQIDGLSIQLIEVYTLIRAKGNEHLIFCYDKHKSPGKTGSFLRTYELILLSLAIRREWGDDETVYEKLQEKEQQLFHVKQQKQKLLQAVSEIHQRLHNQYEEELKQLRGLPEVELQKKIIQSEEKSSLVSICKRLEIEIQSISAVVEQAVEQKSVVEIPPVVAPSVPVFIPVESTQSLDGSNPTLATKNVF